MSCEEHGGELDLEKGVFLRRREADSGNNSLQSSTGTASSKLSQPPTSFLEEDEADFEEEIPSPEVRIKRPAANTNIIEVRYRGEPKNQGAVSTEMLRQVDFSERNPLPRGTGRQHGGGGEQERRKSRHVNRLQITNV